MTDRDAYGYPVTRVLAGGFLAPTQLADDATAAEREQHAEAYAAYQDRYRRAFMARARYRRRNG